METRIKLLKDELVNAKELLQSYVKKDSENTIKVIHDRKDVITHIYIEFFINKVFFYKIWKLVQYHGTHRRIFTTIDFFSKIKFYVLC